jgi:hypothetical protein
LGISQPQVAPAAGMRGQAATAAASTTATSTSTPAPPRPTTTVVEPPLQRQPHSVGAVDAAAQALDGAAAHPARHEAVGGEQLEQLPLEPGDGLWPGYKSRPDLMYQFISLSLSLSVGGEQLEQLPLEPGDGLWPGYKSRPDLMFQFYC